MCSVLVSRWAKASAVCEAQHRVTPDNQRAKPQVYDKCYNDNKRPQKNTMDVILKVNQEISLKRCWLLNKTTNVNWRSEILMKPIGFCIAWFGWSGAQLIKQKAPGKKCNKNILINIVRSATEIHIVSCVYYICQWLMMNLLTIYFLLRPLKDCLDTV